MEQAGQFPTALPVTKWIGNGRPCRNKVLVLWRPCGQIPRAVQQGGFALRTPARTEVKYLARSAHMRLQRWGALQDRREQREF